MESSILFDTILILLSLLWSRHTFGKAGNIKTIFNIELYNIIDTQIVIDEC